MKLASYSIKIYLDDERPTPAGWYRNYWPDEVIDLLQNPDIQIEEVSLDHDLGGDNRGTGYHLLLWIEEAVATEGFKAPKLGVFGQRLS